MKLVTHVDVKHLDHLRESGCDVGAGNGYVFLPRGHKYFEEHYDNIPVSVHGGLTYAQMYDNHFDGVVEGLDQDTDYWVVGFDTAHLNDSLRNWPMSRVIEETMDLKAQLSRL